MNPVLNGFLLVDDTSRINLKVDLVDIIRAGMTVISRLDEIDADNSDELKELIVLEEAYKRASFVDDLSLWKSMFSLNITTISTDVFVTRSAILLGQVYQYDYRTLNYYNILSILTGDTSDKKSVDMVDSPEIYRIAKAMCESEDIASRRLAEAFLSSREIAGLLEDNNTSLRSDFDRQQNVLDSLATRNYLLETMYKENIKAFAELNTFLELHEIATSQDTVDKVNLTKFQSRPRIIYLKEYQDLLFLNSFLTTLHNVFSYQLRRKVQIIRLLDSSSTTKVLSMPEHYKKIGKSFTKGEVLGESFLYKVGGYTELLNLVLTNSSGLDLLILVDQRKSPDTVISGRCLQLGLCRSTKVMQQLRLDPTITIVNNNPMTLMSWDYYAEYGNLSEEDMLLFLSSRPPIQRIIELERLYNGEVTQ